MATLGNNGSIRHYSKGRSAETGPFKNMKKHVLKFRLYPLPTNTGIMKNYYFSNHLASVVDAVMRKEYKDINCSSVPMRELYEKCPYGNTCKILELQVNVYTKKENKDKIIWIEV